MKLQKRKTINRITGVICAAALCAGVFPFESRASTQQDELVKQSIMEATGIIENAISKSYDKAEAEVKQKIVDGGLDYYMTMESFYRQENPYKDANYLEMIAAYATAKEYEDTLKVSDFYSLPFVKAEVKKKEETEYEPMLVQVYKESSDGVYVEDGRKYINEPVQMDTYKRNSDDTFSKEGSTTITPRTVTTIYGEVTLTGMTAEDILKYYGISDNEEAIRAYEKKVTQFGALFRGRGLNESVFVNVNQDLMTNNMKEYLTELFESDVSPYRLALIKEAVQLLGKVPYEWGGKASQPGYDTSWWTFDETGSQKGLDCSGYVQWAFMTAGYDKSVTDKMLSTAMMLGNLETIARKDIQPGDLGLLNNGQTINHVGIYMGEGYWIHCSSEADTVVIEKTDMFRIFKKMPDYAQTPEEIPEDLQEETKALEENQEEAATPVPTQTPKSVFEIEQTTKEPEQTSEEKTAITVENTYNETCSYTEEEIYLLAQLIYNEANGEGMNGWIAVAEVVRNRVESDLFPDTISEVIYQKNPVQFSDYQKIATRKPSEEQIFVAREVLSGNLQILGDSNVLYFRNAKGSTADWGKNRFFKTINNHQFYTNG